MALGVYTNTYSLIAQNSLTTANSSISKSIERLSSGLRINHAADDASGLAISEKLRGQIRGMAKASLNAQDAISFLQTAEGGLEVIGSMLQRMRELAVQAGNGTFTTNDRAELQKEVDQLKEEVNRISSSTEYNTKKLLTGDAAALWSASTDDIQAIVRSAPAEGNYRLDFAVEGGKNAIYKTDVMSVNKHTAVIRNAGGTGLYGATVTKTDMAHASASATVAIGVVASAITSAETFGTAVASYALTAGSAMTTSGYLEMEYLADSAATGVNVKVTFHAADGGTASKVVLFSAVATTVDFGGYGRMDLTYTHNALNVDNSKELIMFQDAITATTTAHIEMVSGTMTSASTAITNGQASSIVARINTTTGTVETTVVNFDFNNNAPTAGTATLDVIMKGTPATAQTKLEDISRFVNSDGRMILDNTQELTIYGNNEKTTISIEGKDTVQDFIDKFNAALNKLGMDGNVRYNPDLTGTGNDAMPGTIVYESNSLVGAQSEIKLVGDESLINALSVAQIQDAEGAEVTVTVTDAHTGKTIGSDRVSDFVLRNVIKGVDVKMDASVQDGTTAYLHVVDNRTEVQIGANEGQKFDISIAEMSTRALEIDDANVMTMKDSQKAITKFDQALTKVTSSRATIGAQINRLEYTMANLSVSRQNLVTAESRIRDLDVAEESANFARNQILVNSAVAMLAQANQLPQVALQLIGSR